jgi:GlpG protein
MIGQLDGEAKARKFGDYLYAQGIDNQVEADQGSNWAVWILEEADLARAAEMLTSFRSNPADPKYQGAAQVAGVLKEKKKQEQAAYEKRIKERQHLFRSVTGYGFGPLTFVLIAVSVVAFISKYVNGPFAMNGLYFSVADVSDTWSQFMNRLTFGPGSFPEIRQGEVWRVLTPIFIHMSVIHILFNMLWLRDLGSMIEGRQSSYILLAQVIVIAILSNTAQYVLHGGAFGGMSGVVYGLFGYIWIRGKLDPASGLFMQRSTVVMMIVWFFACLSGLIGPIANTVHGVGLVVGMAWGALSSIKHR